MVKKTEVKQIAFALMAAAMLVLVGCKSAPIYNVSDAPVDANAKNLTTENVKKAIIRAGVGLGWQIKEAGPGKLVGTLLLRKHMAKIDIPYSKEGYSLLYRESSQLNYKPETGEIHKNYNGWIQNLDRAIQSQLMGL
ncbi:hypothetical protein ACFL3U_00840 [Pseudomonadota bacterium]